MLAEDEPGKEDRMLRRMGHEQHHLHSTISSFGGFCLLPEEEGRTDDRRASLDL